MSRVCTVAVRAGSKGVPGKNWRMVAGKPLFAHSVQHAVASGLFDAIVVTSDAPEVLKTALSFGATHLVRRPIDLSSDTAGKVPAILHAVQTVEELIGYRFDTVVDLDATSPLRDVGDVQSAVSLLESNEIESVITVCEARRSPYFNLVEVDSDSGRVSLSKQTLSGVLRRQDAPDAFDMNASVYVWDRRALDREPKVFFPSTRIFEMPPERSMDIDSEFDLKIVSWLLEGRGF